MSSGACRALVAVLLTLVASATLALPVGAATDSLVEESVTTYTVDPAAGTIDVRILLTLRNDGSGPVNLDEWGPVYVEDVANPNFTPRSIGRSEFLQLPGLWKSMQLLIPRIPGGGGQEVVRIDYTLNASILDNDSRTPARVGEGYVYFCVPGQDTDVGSVRVIIPPRFRTTQSGTPMEEFNRGLQLDDSNVGDFTCIEGTAQRRLATTSFIGSGGREVVLQAWPESDRWLVPARNNVEQALDEIELFLGQPIPGDDPVTVRQAPPRTLGGYASGHDTPGVVQMDEAAGVDPDTRNHEIAHAWFGTNNFIERWMREGLASWTATTMARDTCAPVDPDGPALDLSEWQVVRPTAPSDIEEVIAAQDAAACGIMATVAERMDDETWLAVVGSMLNGEAKYIGTEGIGRAATSTVDYREWLDAVDERGLVPSGHTDLDYAQDLLSAYSIPPDPLLLVKRSDARARYHQFLVDASPMGAPVAVREAMDNWFFDDAQVALDKSYEVLDALTEADALLPEAGLIPFIQPGFEAARSTEDLDVVLQEAIVLLDTTEEIIAPLTELRQVSPAEWGLPAAVRTAITEQRFEDVVAAIDPSLEIVQEVTAADAALPQAGFLEKYQTRYETTATAGRLEELAASAAEERVLAEQAGIAFTALQGEVGDWRIPSAVTDPISGGQLDAAISILGDARGVVGAAKGADIALPEANLSADIRPQFEAVEDASDMTALRSAAEKVRDDARSVGNALNSLRARVPGWTIPAVVSDPIERRDFAQAALSAAAAQKWVENAWQADQDLPGVINAIARTRPEFENAATLDELRFGGELAEDWATAASRVNNAIVVFDQDRDLLAELGLWGTDMQPVLDEAIEAAIAGNVALATAKAAEVIETIRGGTGAGGLRLAGLVFLGIALLGVLGLWWLFRREAGPPWARQTTPHWVKDSKPRLLGRRRKDG